MGRPKGSKNKPKTEEAADLSGETLQTSNESTSIGAASPDVVPPSEPAPVKRGRSPVSVPSFDIKELLTGLFTETMPQMMAAVVTALKDAEVKAQLAAHKKKDFGQKCQQCGQYEIACQGKHRKAIVYPTNHRARWARFFSGVWLNGVKYLSSRPGHQVTVPADFYPEVDTQRWEMNEEQQANGRESYFDSGNLSATGNSTTFRADARNGWDAQRN